MTNPAEQNYIFDARQHAPETGQDPVPAATYDVTIDDTDVVDIKDNKGWFLKVVFKIISGEFIGRKVTNNYNIGHLTSAETVRIAHGQLSSLCHVTGRFQVTKANKGAELRGANLRIQVSNDGSYNNLKAVFDTNGNRPEKSGTGHAPAATAPVATATPGAGWGAAAPAPVAVATPAAPAAPAAAPQTAAQVAAQYGVQHYEGHRYDPASNSYKPDAPAPVAPAAPPAPAFAPAAPTAPAAPAAAPAAWSQAPGAVPPAPWGAPAA